MSIFSNSNFSLLFYVSFFFPGKNLEIEFAVRDLLKTISSYKLEAHVEEVNKDDMTKLKKVLCTVSVCVRK
jgi:hypothetical protein